MPTLIQPDTLRLTHEQITVLLPYLLVFGGACLSLLASVFPSTKPHYSVPAITIVSFLAAAVSCLELLNQPTRILFSGMLIGDGFSSLANLVFLACGGLIALNSFRYLERQSLNYSEYYILLAFSVLGMMLMVSSLNLILLFIALELMSLSIYCLVGFRRNDRRSNEAAVKYYILGSAASAVLLYGAALLYGATLSVDIRVIAERATQNGLLFNPMTVLGLLCVLVGFLFKVASVPFHMWMPDVYEGAPTPVTALMTTGLKAAVFVALVRLSVQLASGAVFGPAVAPIFHKILWVSALATMFFGNLLAVQQTNLKRLLAYSSIAHSGYLLVGLLAGFYSPEGFSAVLFYVVVYAIMNLGAFTVLTALSLQGDSGLELADLSGLASRHPWLAAGLAAFLFSMAGLPPTAGFTAKYFLLYEAVQAQQIWLVVLAVLCSAIGAFYYLRVLVYMYMREPSGQTTAPIVSPSWLTSITVAVAFALVLQLGLFPASALQLVEGVSKGQSTATALAQDRNSALPTSK